MPQIFKELRYFHNLHDKDSFQDRLVLKADDLLKTVTKIADSFYNTLILRLMTMLKKVIKIVFKRD